MKFKINRDHFAQRPFSSAERSRLESDHADFEQRADRGGKGPDFLDDHESRSRHPLQNQGGREGNGSGDVAREAPRHHRARAAEPRCFVRRVSESPGEAFIGRFDLSHQRHRQGGVSTAAGVRGREILHPRAKRTRRHAEERRLRAVERRNPLHSQRSLFQFQRGQAVPRGHRWAAPRAHVERNGSTRRERGGRLFSPRRR